MQINSNKIGKIIITITMICAIFSTSSFPVSYAVNTPPSIPVKECQDTLTREFDAEIKDFFQFLDTNFKNQSATSSLVSLAIARYSEYRDTLRDQLKRIQVEGVESGEQSAQYALCQELVETYISRGRAQMMTHIKSSAAQKKTVMLLEKLKALNIKLRGLNMKIAEMFALFDTFETKFPGFICQNCMKQ